MLPVVQSHGWICICLVSTVWDCKMCNVLYVLSRSVVECSRASQRAGARRNLSCWCLQLLHHYTGSDLTNSALRHDGHARPWWLLSCLELASFWHTDGFCLPVSLFICWSVCLGAEIVERLRAPPPVCRPLVCVDEAPAECLSLMAECWNEDPDKRPTFHHIFKQVVGYFNML